MTDDYLVQQNLSDGSGRVDDVCVTIDEMASIFEFAGEYAIK